MITLFTIPKKFEGDIGIIQNKAIESWKKTGCDILLLNEDELKKNKHGVPLVSSMLEVAQEKAKGDIVCYISTDILLPEDFAAWIELVEYVLYPNNFIVFGKRHDIQKDGTVKPRGMAGLDYWAFPKGMVKNFPDFALGRRAFDNYLLALCNKKGIPTIDASEVIKIYHQWHIEHKYTTKENNEMVLENLKMANGLMGTLRDTTHILTKEGIKERPWSPYKLIKPLIPIWRKLRQL